MKIRIITKAGLFAGGIIIFYSLIQWGFLYEDLSQLIFGVWTGISLCLFSYIYSFLKSLKREFREIEEAQDKRYDYLYNKIKELKK